ncbi:secretoglobin family 3A member 2-like [Malaclemys terrapin pileata]|uniref:secretoglobin family 3A member 2-like n=1 Tax=Malaclemys terrapin pileata TaxID=2991368 RepID=UPI0023A7BE96|nr:secretoglobin family 3A member 2-like [Malaclemys terrapin pileata]
MKLTVVFTLVTLAVCCYSASALLVDSLLPNVVSVPVDVLNDLIGGVQGCVNELTPKALSALNRVLGILSILNVLG